MAAFNWAPAAELFTGALGLLGKKAVADANAESSNAVRAANNLVSASATGLAATMRAINTARMLEAAGQREEIVTRNLVRTQDAFTRGSFEQGLAAMEALGSSVAMQAASGVGGSVQALSMAHNLKQARITQAAQERNAQVTYDLLQQRAGIIPAAIGEVDMTPNITRIDPRVDQSKVTMFGAPSEFIRSEKDTLKVAVNQDWSSVWSGMNKTTPAYQPFEVNFPTNTTTN